MWVKVEVKWTGVRIRREVKVGFRVNCRVWGYESCGGESISFEYRRDNLNIIQSDSTIGITS